MNTANRLRAALLGAALALPLLAPCAPARAEDPGVEEAKAYVARITAPRPPWDGPTSGPAAQRGKSVVYVSADQRNGGVRGVGRGVEEAAKALGWTFRLIDGQGSVAGRSAALTQAIALKPQGIVLGSVDANEQAALLDRAAKEGIAVVGWHTLAEPGPSRKFPIVTNIATDARDVARAAASYAVAESDGKAGVVIFTDSTYEIAIAKSDEMAAVVRKCAGCAVLQVEDTPVSDTSNRMPPLTTALLQRHGARWTHSLAINDLYFDFMSGSLIQAGVGQDGRPMNVSAGDGSEAAFQRIRQNFYQRGTVAEPLLLHGWQAVDELNRAFAGQPPSGYVTPVHLITAANIGQDGGPQNTYDPDNGYRDAYRRIWGVR